MWVRISFLIAIMAITTKGRAESVGSDFQGEWVGAGQVLSGDSANPVAADFDLKIQKTEKSLTIEDCWTVVDAQLGQRRTCYQNQFAVNEFDQVLAGENKVGDIFPDYILIYQGTSQVAEQMKFGLKANGGLVYNYTYSNEGGDRNVRSAQLQRP